MTRVDAEGLLIEEGHRLEGAAAGGAAAEVVRGRGVGCEGRVRLRLSEDLAHDLPGRPAAACAG